MINILFVHQSAELYGSDKTLLLLLQNLDKDLFFPVVILPNDGPLKEKLLHLNIEVHIAPVLKLHRKMFNPTNLILFIKQIRAGIKAMDLLNKKHHFDIVYSNTLAVLLGIIFASKRNIKHIWHVHEIIESPRFFKIAFQKMLTLKSNSVVVYNSLATQRFWDVNKIIISKSLAIQNGQELAEIDLDESAKKQLRKTLFSVDNEVVIALIGRISRWKGQLVLLEAFKHLTEHNKNIKLVFVGSTPPNQEEFLDNLQQQIIQYQLENDVIIVPFQENIAAVWHAIDIAVVPSTEPEPFGLVALEGMLAQKPVVASNHGGLSEIVVNNETGFLVEPTNVQFLANALQLLITNPEMRTNFGANGYKRARNEFSVEKYVDNFEDLFRKLNS